MATTAPSWTPLISRILGSSTNASKIGKSPVEGLKKMYSTPAALSCCTNSAPPVPCTSRIADAGAVAESDCAIAFTATELIPSAERPVMSLRREMPLSRYCLIRSFMSYPPSATSAELSVVPAKAGTHNHHRYFCRRRRATSPCCGVWVPAFAGTTEYHPPVAPESRPAAASQQPSDRARRDVHRQCEQRGIEDERYDAVAEDGAADRLAAHRHVGYLRAHPDHEREIHEIPIVRLALAAGKLHAAALAVILVVVFMRIMQREDRVRERP